MSKPSNVCLMLLALDLALGCISFYAIELGAMSAKVGIPIGLCMLALLVGTYYVREFAVRAEERLGWK